jgi:transposase
MSLKPSSIEPVPEETSRIARAAFPKGNLYLSIRDKLGNLFEKADFTGLFLTRGQPAFPPWRLDLITASAVFGELI